MAGWTREILDFWFGLRPEQWWKADPQLDEEIRERFLETWQRERERLPGEFLGSAETALAAVILFDQFPRNMFRGRADSFATDILARTIADEAIGRGFDTALPKERRGFLYLPFEHSEDKADQRRSLLLFEALGDPELLRYAHLHHDLIERFGRFPHRNAMLGREPRAAELAAGNVVPW
jgi:uncharacterized protein (DUF924 family)